ncbi:MAG: sugar ABC transporter permease [Caldilineaceae bacterium]|nr:sugar ABC transporter permease [Caldilineaceae bacterium]
MAVSTKPAKAGGISNLAKSEERLAIWLLIPTLVVLFVIAIFPLGRVFYTSFTNEVFASTTETQFVGMANYQQLLSMAIRELPPVLDASGNPQINPDTGETIYERPIAILPREPLRYREVGQFGFLGNKYVVGASDPEFILAMKDTLSFTFWTVLLETILGMIVALVVNVKFVGRGAMRAVMLVPWAIPTAVSSKMWEWMFGSTRTGFFNVIFQNLGLGNGQIPFLESPAWQMPAMIMIDVWKTTPFMALLLLAGLQLIPADVYEAADIDGAGKMRQFFSITLPLLRPTLAVALVFRTLDALRVFDLFQIVLAQTRYSMASFSYYELISNRAAGYSSASSVVIFLIIFLFAIIYIRTLGVEAE